jgi:hypothetical protein
MPIPTKAPTNPLTAPPTPNPAKAAMMGPAAMNGPTPGIASAPIPASKPIAPRTTPPVVTPVVVPSGALVFFSCANSFQGKPGETRGNQGQPACFPVPCHGYGRLTWACSWVPLRRTLASWIATYCTDYTSGSAMTEALGSFCQFDVVKLATYALHGSLATTTWELQAGRFEIRLKSWPPLVFRLA